MKTTRLYKHWSTIFYANDITIIVSDNGEKKLMDKCNTTLKEFSDWRFLNKFIINHEKIIIMIIPGGR